MITAAPRSVIAMARAADVSLTIDDFQRVSDRTPLLADMKRALTDIHSGRAQPARPRGEPAKGKRRGKG